MKLKFTGIDHIRSILQCAGIAYARDGAVCLHAMGLTIEYRWRQWPTHFNRLDK